MKEAMAEVSVCGKEGLIKMNKNLLVPIMNRKAKRVRSYVADVQLDLGGVVAYQMCR
jgi:hypothetical protein